MIVWYCRFSYKCAGYGSEGIGVPLFERGLGTVKGAVSSFQRLFFRMKIGPFLLEHDSDKGREKLSQISFSENRWTFECSLICLGLGGLTCTQASVDQKQWLFLGKMNNFLWPSRCRNYCTHGEMRGGWPPCYHLILYSYGLWNKIFACIWSMKGEMFCNNWVTKMVSKDIFSKPTFSVSLTW